MFRFDRPLFRVPGLLLSIAMSCLAVHAASSPEADGIRWFRDNPAWVMNTDGDTAGVLSYRGAAGAPQLRAWLETGDALVRMTYRLPDGGDPAAVLMMQARYPVPLDGAPGEWHTLEVRVRGARYDEANIKTDQAFILDARRDGELVMENVLFSKQDPRSEYEWENGSGPTTIIASQPGVEIRDFEVRRADFTAVMPPNGSGAETNFPTLIDFVALGRAQFGGVGCMECHAIEPDSTAVKTGPNLYGLFRINPIQREIADPEGHRFLVTVDRTYLHNAIREPQHEIAIAQTAGIVPAGEPYLPVMPPYPEEVVSDQQIEAIGAFLMTLNPPAEQGPVERWLEESGPENYDPLADRFLLLVDDRVRVQRGPLDGVSGRSIHVGQPSGLHYTFDPRVLGVAKLWQGGFLDMEGEWRNRGGGGLKPGHESREIALGEAGVLFAPLHVDGTAIDFGFKESRFGDTATRVASLESDEDHLTRLAREDAAFLGYERDSRDPLAAPVFRYRVGRNTVTFAAHLGGDGVTELVVAGDWAEPQLFRVDLSALHDVRVSAGVISEAGIWKLPADAPLPVKLRGQLSVMANPWRPTPSEFDAAAQPLAIEAAAAQLPAGYSIENYGAPLDNYGRNLLFEALGLDRTADGTLLVTTRTAGIWRVVDGEWRQFAEGLFDSLGGLAEDDSGLVVVAGHKSGLSRISDTNGDGVADRYEVLTDAFSYHGNYHSYVHGPVRSPDGNYFITLNLAHNTGGGYFNAGGHYMGTAGGFRGWAIEVPATGGFVPWADGLRSPAGLGFAPDGRLWYADNQGEFMATSKLYVLREGGFYGHPSALVDRPGMTPSSPEIAWDAVKHTKEREVVLLPQLKLANSPGNPAWDTTGGHFGPYAGQMFIGDQTQSVLMRIDTEVVGGIEQGVAIPFARALESGVMRPLFLADGSLLLGQTGRGWQAKGGKVASLQRLAWDGQTVAPALRTMKATPDGFALHLTQPLPDSVATADVISALALESWTYRDAPDYGSDELAPRTETVAAAKLNATRDVVTITLGTTLQPHVHEMQTARVYHLTVNGVAWWGETAMSEPGLEAYYTLYRFASATP